MKHVLFLYSSVDGPLGCFHLLAVMSNVATNICIQVFVGVVRFCVLGKLVLGL